MIRRFLVDSYLGLKNRYFLGVFLPGSKGKCHILVGFAICVVSSLSSKAFVCGQGVAEKTKTKSPVVSDEKVRAAPQQVGNMPNLYLSLMKKLVYPRSRC